VRGVRSEGSEKQIDKDKETPTPKETRRKKHKMKKITN
jgi:hypothetical protein